MMPAWVADYVGLPYRAKGRDRDGLDCWGLVRLVMLEVFRVELHSYTAAYATPTDMIEVSAVLKGEIPESGWQPVVDAPRAGDGVVFRLLGQPWHVGLIVEPGRFLHIEEGAGSVVDRLDSPRWARRIHGIFRHEALA